MFIMIEEKSIIMVGEKQSLIKNDDMRKLISSESNGLNYLVWA